jgi:hypothetical protein
MKTLLLALCLLAAPQVLAQAPTAPMTTTAAMTAGVKGDGKTDDTSAIQVLLDAAGKTGGEVVLPPGQYLLRGNLKVPTGVVLQGSWRGPHHGAWQRGSTFLVTGGRGEENGAAAITLQQSSALRGFTMLWPEQKWPNVAAYPFAIQGVGMHPTVEDVTFVNAFQGVKIGGPDAWSELHLVRNVFGCVLRRGVFVDTTSDIGRLENVHFNPHYWPRSGHASAAGAKDMEVARYMADNLEAFIFGRTDWEYVSNCFVFAAKIGYRFIETSAGACNAQLMNIGADFCRVGLQIDKIQPIGIQVTNGAFTAFAGAPNVGVATDAGAIGAAQFVNCNFWTTPGGAAHLEGALNVAFSDCHFLDVPDFDAKHSAITALAGRLNVRGSTFGKAGRAIEVGPRVMAALVTANLQPGGLRVQNAAGARAQIALNEVLVAPTSVNYRLRLGAPGDENWVRGGWHGGEPSKAAGPNSPFEHARWSRGAARIELPIAAPAQGKALTVRVHLSLPAKAPPQVVSIEGAPAVSASKAGMQIIDLQVPAAATVGRASVDLLIAGKTWKPSELQPPSGDTRDLGAYVFGVEVIAEPGAALGNLN